MSPTVTVAELPGGRGLEQWSERWDRLATAVGGRYFQSPAWVSAWTRVYEPAADLHVLVDGPTDAPDGLLVLASLRRRLHHRVPIAVPYVGLAGSWRGAADLLGPLVSSEASARRLLDAAVTVAGRRPLVLPDVAPAWRGAVAALPGVVHISTERCPVLELGGGVGIDDVWDAKLRKNLRRRERLAGEAGLVRRWVIGGSGGAGLLDDLRRLHVARWTGRGGGLFDERRMQFLAALDALSSDDQGVRIQLIEHDGRPVAALLGFDYGTTFSAYKSGWDPAFSRFGLGLLLHAGAIERALNAGLTRYDFLRGPHPHKLRLGGRPVDSSTFMVPTPPLGPVLLRRDRWYAHRIADQYAAAHPDEVPAEGAVGSLMDRVGGRSGG